MTDSATARNDLRKQSLASNRGTWGDPNLNEVLDSIDESLDGYVEIDVSGGTNVTLSTTDYATNEARQRMLKFTGTMTASISVIIPDVEKWYIIWDASTRAGYTLTFKNSSGTGITPTNGQREIVLCDASEVYKVESGNTLSSIGAPTASVDFSNEKIINLATPTDATDGASKGYVDATIAASAILPLTSDWGNVTTGTTVQLKRDTTANIAAYTGSAGELVVDTSRNSVKVQDGSTAGGHELVPQNAMDAVVITGGTINNATIGATTPASGVFTTGVFTTARVTAGQLVNEQTGTSYTLVLTDAGKLIECNNGSPFTLTIPLNSSVAIPVGSQITVVQTGAGQVTFSAAGGVTLNSRGSATKTYSQYAIAVLYKQATDVWILGGDVSV